MKTRDKYNIAAYFYDLLNPMKSGRLRKKYIVSRLSGVVLELGVGTGHYLYKSLPKIKKYVAIDFALNRLRL